MTLAAPILRKWAKSEYRQATDLGWFKGERVELIDGEVIRMAAQRDEHAMSLRLTDVAVRACFGDGYVFCIQMPLNVAGNSEPEPDVAVVRGSVRSLKRHPTTAALIVEISDTTLNYDRGRKARLYASRGIKDYWIVNLVDRQLEVCRKPIADGAEPFGHDYSVRTIFLPGQSVSPLGAGRAKIKVADMLP
jgi:Uma2 family endonuclease